MSRFGQFDPGRTRRYSITGRLSKVAVAELAAPAASDRVSALLESMPRILAAESLRRLVAEIRKARSLQKPIIWGFGGHVVKVGLAPILLDLMDQGFVTAMATNGSGVVHDFELAMWGATSEDVDSQLDGGAFGMAEETGRMLNGAINEGVASGLGVGEAVGRFLASGPARFPEISLLLGAFRRKIPLTVHLAIGTDIIHCHPEASGAALGEGSLRDFLILTHQVAHLDGGGLYLNIGSAVVLPEVFLKAVTMVRSSGVRLEEFGTANLDFIQHYRPSHNVVRRPVQKAGFGVSLTGHHEIMIPLLAALLKTDLPAAAP